MAKVNKLLYILLCLICDPGQNGPKLTLVNFSKLKIYLKIWNLRVLKNLNIWKIAVNVVQMKFLAMHITNQKLRFYIFTV